MKQKIKHYEMDRLHQCYGAFGLMDIILAWKIVRQGKKVLGTVPMGVTSAGFGSIELGAPLGRQEWGCSLG